jgi:hypothetical protein
MVLQLFSRAKNGRIKNQSSKICWRVPEMPHLRFAEYTGQGKIPQTKGSAIHSHHD